MSIPRTYLACLFSFLQGQHFDPTMTKANSYPLHSKASEKRTVALTQLVSGTPVDTENSISGKSYCSFQPQLCKPTNQASKTQRALGTLQSMHQNNIIYLSKSCDNWLELSLKSINNTRYKNYCMQTHAKTAGALI